MGNAFENENYDMIYRDTIDGQHAKTQHTHDFYELFITMNDKVLHLINGKEQLLRKNMLVLIRPGDVHFFAHKDMIEPHHINLAFRKEIMDDFFAYLGRHGEELRRHLVEAPLPPACLLVGGERERMLAQMKAFAVQDAEKQLGLRLKIRFFIADAVSLLTQNMDSKNREEIPEWLEKTCHSMHEKQNFTEGLTRMVELSGKTQEHLTRCMQRYKGTTPSRFISDLRLSYAAERLRTDNAQVIDICFDSGFTSLDYFGKQFRTKYGMSPMTFRRLFGHGK